MKMLGSEIEGALDLKAYLSVARKVYDTFSQHSSSANNLGFLLLNLIEERMYLGEPEEILLKDAEFYIDLASKIRSDRSYEVNYIYLNYLDALLHPKNLNFKLLKYKNDLERIEADDDWSFNLLAKIYIQLALIYPQENNYWIKAFQSQHKAIKKSLYRTEYHSRLECMKELALKYRVISFHLEEYQHVRRPSSTLSIPLMKCENLIMNQ